MTDINTELEQIADEEFVADTQLDEVAADAPKKGAAPAEKGDKLEGEVQDMGAAVVSPDAKSDQVRKLLRKSKKLLLLQLNHPMHPQRLRKLK